jgi:hypothetical protein
MTAESTTEARLQGLLRRIQGLAEEVRLTAERVHKETKEAHRLAAIVLAELGRSRELSQSSRREIRQVHGSIERSLDTARASGHPDEKGDVS